MEKTAQSWLPVAEGRWQGWAVSARVEVQPGILSVAKLGALQGPLEPGLLNANKDSKKVCAPPPTWLLDMTASSLSICPLLKPSRAQPDSLLSTLPTKEAQGSERPGQELWTGPSCPLGKRLVERKKERKRDRGRDRERKERPNGVTFAKPPHQTQT